MMTAIAVIVIHLRKNTSQYNAKLQILLKLGHSDLQVGHADLHLMISS